MQSTITSPLGVELRGAVAGRAVEVLTPAALAFLAGLQRTFNSRRLHLLAARQQRQARLDAGERPTFLAETEARRRDRATSDGTWQVAAAPRDLLDRRVEITGPTERKMVINALNSGARVFMADFEDALSPTWQNVVQGQANLRDAVRRTIALDEGEKQYRLKDEIATLVVRPRGWHLAEKHLLVDGEPISASLFDFGLYFFHNAQETLHRGSGPYYYLPKLESHLEARLWNDVFLYAQEQLGLHRGTVRATVLIETILAAFEMEEILYELREHAAGLNAGRWDYIFSVIKKFRNQPGWYLPDRAQVTMTVPFMHAYTERLVQICHRHGAHAIGGMAAFIPSRRDPLVNETALAQVKADKVREVSQGFDGTWVAHPDLIPVARQEFDAVLGTRLNQRGRQRPDVNVTAEQLLDFGVPGGAVSEAGLRANLSIGVQYLASWLRGTGAVNIFNLMEDAATAEISRSQLWQWLQCSAQLSDGRKVTGALVQTLLQEEVARLRDQAGAEAFATGRYGEARALLEQLSLGAEFPEFLTPAAYQLID